MAAHVTKIMDMVDMDHPSGPRARIALSKEDDLQIALNLYTPGSKNEFHYHKGTSQSFLCLKGKLTLRTKENESAEPVTHYLTEGMCVLMPADQYYQLDNESDAPVLLYQVKAPGDQIVIEGKGEMNNKDYFTQQRRKHAVAGEVQ
ncbi:MAG TPA: cupin domain-containing protein [Alphaproteobacteria bacterium]|jgi:mannose-6-phosphate isomerase-like protein (cupin superfamily)